MVQKIEIAVISGNEMTKLDEKLVNTFKNTFFFVCNVNVENMPLFEMFAMLLRCLCS